MCTLYTSETVRARESLKECNTENSNPHGFQQNRHTIQDTTKLLGKVLKAIIMIKTKANTFKSHLPESTKRARTYLHVLSPSTFTPLKDSADYGGVVGPVESATIEVRVNTEVKLDSAGSAACDSTSEECTALQPSSE